MESNSLLCRDNKMTYTYIHTFVSTDANAVSYKSLPNFILFYVNYAERLKNKTLVDTFGSADFLRVILLIFVLKEINFFN